MKVGILGSGFMGGTHARAFAKIEGRRGGGDLLAPPREGAKARE